MQSKRGVKKMKDNQRKEFIRKIIEEVELHYKTHEVFKDTYELPFDYMNEKTIDLYFYYKSECNLRDCEPNKKEFNQIIQELKEHCENTFYKLQVDNEENVTFFIF